MAVLIMFLIKVSAYITWVGFQLRMLNLSIYLCRTKFEFGTVTDFESETEFEIEFFVNTSPG